MNESVMYTLEMFLAAVSEGSGPEQEVLERKLGGSVPGCNFGFLGLRKKFLVGPGC